jgi:DeoR/GlpR family transcriptional regulator of sugar metabolism
MIQIQRHEQILKHLAKKDYLSVTEAINLFAASPATIRRDFNRLARQKLAQRFRGGLKAVQKTSSGMVPFALRQLQYSAEKEALARQAVKLLKPGNVILIDGGTTTFHLGMCLPDISLRVITNSLRLAAMLEERNEEQSSLEISLTGGLLYKKSGILLGPNTEAGLSQYHADFAFLSVGGINEAGIYNTNELVTETERVMIDNADKVVILADHSKIGKQAMCHVCSLEEIDILISNDWPQNDKIFKSFEDSGIEIVKVSG